jgi:hypothetical protein
VQVTQYFYSSSIEVVTMWLRGGKEICTECWWRNFFQIVYLKYSGRWEDKIKMSVRKLGCVAGRWMERNQDLALVLAVLKLRVLLPQCFIVVVVVVVVVVVIIIIIISSSASPSL